MDMNNSDNGVCYVISTIIIRRPTPLIYVVPMFTYVNISKEFPGHDIV